MAGIGKTTFAKRMYHHPTVNNGYFDKILWCAVSQMYERKGLLMDILICIKSDLKDTIKNLDERDLKLKIYQSLKDRRYLLVMDDVWDLKVWDDLQFLPDDRNGSRILITGRNMDAAPSRSIRIELPYLSSDQCWELLREKIFQREPCPPQLQEIGKEIAINCRGLPLAAVVIAGVLANQEKEESIWESVGQNLGHYMLSDRSSSTMEILELSYKHLPHYLKPCFLCFGLFKKGSVIQPRYMIQLWTALGFICKKGEQSAEHLGNEYLMELIDRSLVEVVKRRLNGGVKLCGVHDLLREMCQEILRKENFPKVICGDSIVWNQRYLISWIDKEDLVHASDQCIEPYSLVSRAICCHFWNWEFLLRLIGRLPGRSSVHSFWGSSFFLFNIKLLRTLYLLIKTQHEFVGIESLVHLRYLEVMQLPSSLHKNVNLDFVVVGDVFYITSEIIQMPKLKSIEGSNGIFVGNCDEFSRTSKLQYLRDVHIHNLEELELLKYVPNLRKLKFQISMLWVKIIALVCDLQFLTQLESLRVCGGIWLGPSRSGEIKFPSNITKLTLRDMAISLKMMSAIGALLYLQVLKLQEFVFIEGETWETRDGEFKQLRILKLENLILVQWDVSSNQHFPKLQQLFLKHCDRLKDIPQEIGEIETLEMIKVRGRCLGSLVKSAARIQEEQHDMGNQCLRVDIQRTKIADSSSDADKE